MDVEQVMQQAQGIQQRMLALQEELGAEHLEHTVGDGLVTFTCTGRKAPVAIKLDPRIQQLPDVTLLEDLIMLAIAGASEKADEMLSKRTEEMMAEMGLPADFQLPS